MLRDFFHKLRASICRRQSVYVAAWDVAQNLAQLGKTDFPPGIECAVVESPEQIEAYEDEMPSSFRDSVESLKQRVAQGCVVFLARMPKQDGPGRQVVGYRLAEKGVFSALDLKGKVSQDILFIHYIEVLPAFRLQKIARFLVKASLEYCVARGLKKTLTVGSPLNQLSARAFRKDAADRLDLGTVEKVSLLRGLIVWWTPWKKIERTLKTLEA
jgi:ribosomal protein S18 acetylase RimI-like enzyme